MPGRNELSIVATSDEGETRVPLALSRPGKGVWIDFESLQCPGDKSISPQLGTSGLVVFPEVGLGTAVLRGRVTWDDERDEQLKRDDLQVRVFVNGLQQPSAPLRRLNLARPEMVFELPVVLNRREDNRLDLVLPEELRPNAANRSEAWVRLCRKPQREHRLNLLLVSAHDTDSDKLRGNFLTALEVKSAGGPGLSSDEFAQVKVWGPLTEGYVTEDYVVAYLRAIRQTLLQRSRDGFPNDVVWVYCDGRESTSGRDRVLQTADGRVFLSYTEIEHLFRGTPRAS